MRGLAYLFVYLIPGSFCLFLFWLLFKPSTTIGIVIKYILLVSAIGFLLFVLFMGATWGQITDM